MIESDWARIKYSSVEFLERKPCLMFGLSTKVQNKLFAYFVGDRLGRPSQITRHLRAGIHWRHQAIVPQHLDRQIKRPGFTRMENHIFGYGQS